MHSSARPRPAIPFMFRWLREELAGGVFAAHFARTWPAYRAWFLKEGDAARPSLATCRDRLDRFMPELVPAWEQLLELTGGDPLVARMLSLYRPTPYVMACSQAVWSQGAPLLVRNYDYHPSSCEGVFLHSGWMGQGTIVASDCLWGVLDGMNESGLVVSLAFGGRREVGDGFGIPLILRYILETCRDTSGAMAVLDRVPSHMSYNVSVLDAAGERLVAAVAPDRSTSFRKSDVATNHQDGLGWARYGQATKSAEREEYLQQLVANPDLSAEGFTNRFLRPPLYKTQYDRSMGTIYTAAYSPTTGRVSHIWPNHRVDSTFESFESSEHMVRLGALA